MKKKNNNQIDGTSYYKLPCGKQLEDYIYERGIGFIVGSAIKYCWRAGKKDGESADKDMAKCRHFCEYLATHDAKGITANDWIVRVKLLTKEAESWDGDPWINKE